jgi:hypothetical protein
MVKCGAMFFALILTGGCKMIWEVQPSSGRVLDARNHYPIVNAEVVRVCDGNSSKIKTDQGGCFNFPGKRIIEIMIGDSFEAPAVFKVKAAGYEPFETNYIRFAHAGQHKNLHYLGEIQLEPI